MLLFPVPIPHTPPPECITRHITSDEAPADNKYVDPAQEKRYRVSQSERWRRWDAGLSTEQRRQAIRQHLDRLVEEMAATHHPAPWAAGEIIMLGQALGLPGYAKTNTSSIRERLNLYAAETGLLKTVHKGGRRYGYVLNLEENS